MQFQGYKITYNYDDWQQVALIGNFWDYIAQFVPRDKIVGLGWNWNDEAHTFDYAIGVINDHQTLAQLAQINFDQVTFKPEYTTVQLPKDDWQIFSGHVDNLRQIYEQQIDPLGEKDYELEYINDAGQLKIKIHLK